MKTSFVNPIKKTSFNSTTSVPPFPLISSTSIHLSSSSSSTSSLQPQPSADLFTSSNVDHIPMPLASNLTTSIITVVESVNDLVHDSRNILITTSSTIDNTLNNYNNLLNIHQPFNTSAPIHAPAPNFSCSNTSSCCSCACRCVDVCFCGIPGLCLSLPALPPPSSPVGNDLYTFMSEVIEDTKPITLAIFERLMLELHLRKAHLNFKDLIDQFRKGLYDTDHEFQIFSVDRLAQLKKFFISCII